MPGARCGGARGLAAAVTAPGWARSAAACSWARPTIPAIAYATAPLSNVVDDLNRRLQDGSARLTFEGRAATWRSALDALALPIDSQLLLFSQGQPAGRG